MRESVIRKTSADLPVAPHLADVEADRASFSWQQVREELIGRDAEVNIARLAVDRHAAGARAARTALRFLQADGGITTLSYAELKRDTDRFANALAALGVGRGDRVFVLSGRMPALYVSVLGALKAGCVVTPLFSAFGPEPIVTRMTLGEAKVLVTTEALYRRKVEAVRSRVPTLQHVIVAAEGDEPPSGTLAYGTLMRQTGDAAPAARTAGSDLALLHFTSGTTGTPKGAMHVHDAVLTHFATGRYALDLHDDDIFWCTADPGWVTGMSYGIVAPLLHGVTSIVDEAEFDAERWYRILQEERVSVWYTAPTAIRMLMKAGPELAQRFSHPARSEERRVGKECRRLCRSRWSPYH
jgi:acetyl-CoA synthetase